MDPSEFPNLLAGAVLDARQTLCDALLDLDYPNGGRDAPLDERNVVLHLAHALMNRGFSLYLEANFGSREKLDLVGRRDRIAVAIEAKTTGNVAKKCLEAIDALNRLSCFEPKMTSRAEGAAIDSWWHQSECWSVLLFASHSNELRDAWICSSSASPKTPLVDLGKV